MGRHPLFSVIMPSFNHARYVAAAVKSIQNQTAGDFELIVIDDGSSDGSVPILTTLAEQDKRLRLFARANQGAPATINEGIASARGDWISIINSDDLYSPARLEKMLQAAEAVKADWSFAQVDYIDGKGDSIQPEQIDWYRTIQNEIKNCPTVGFALLKHNVTITTGNLFFRRKLFDLVGPFRDLQLIHDWDFALRLLRQSEPIYLDEPLYWYRLHRENTIRTVAQSTTDREVNFVLRDYFLSVYCTKPPNDLAPGWHAQRGYSDEIDRLDFQGKSYRIYMPSEQERAFVSAEKLA